MKIKTSELKGVALDWAVAKAEAWTVEDHIITHVTTKFYSPSTDWAHGGAIIEREKIAINSPRGVGWIAEMWSDATHPVTGHFTFGSGDTPLEAAMRCYVASKLGNEVEVPDEIAN